MNTCTLSRAASLAGSGFHLAAKRGAYLAGEHATVQHEASVFGALALLCPLATALVCMGGGEHCYVEASMSGWLWHMVGTHPGSWGWPAAPLTSVTAWVWQVHLVVCLLQCRGQRVRLQLPRWRM